MLKINSYTDFNSLSQALTHQWITLITDTPSDQPCRFALAGGTTPAPLYRELDTLLAKHGKRTIQFVATDERWVPDTDPESNEGLFRRCFIQSSSLWQLLSLKNNQPNPASAIADINLRLKAFENQPFNTVILGMGVDGHIASLFPDAPQFLIKDDSRFCVAVHHPQTKQARISLSFSRLLDTQAIWIVITGEKKRTVLENASPESPIGALLTKAQCDVNVFWCPD